MPNVRISQIAAELGYSSKEIITKAQEMGLNKVKTASNSVTEQEAQAIYEYVQNHKNLKKDNKKESKKTTKKAEKKEEPKNTKTTTKKETPIKNEDDKKEILTESLATSSLKTRRGLVIVKKKKDESKDENVAETKEEAKPKIQQKVSLDTILSNTQEILKKKKKEKKPIVATKKESTQKIDLSSDTMADTIIDDSDDVVVLPELSIKPIEVESRSHNSNQPQIYRSAQNQMFGNYEGGMARLSRKKRKKVVKEKENEVVTSIEIPKEIRVYEFADKLHKQSSEIISKLFALGMMTTKNDFLDEDAIEILAEEFGVEVKIIDEASEFDYVKTYEENEEVDDKDLKIKAPVITIMGHVDHGKTSLLDYIRNSRVATNEAGGITQHVGAYMVEKNNRKITFIDTPGHEAFTSMRARGAGVTDIVIIVVAADDGVKPQTKEAINHAKAANVPIIIAINKMDKENANPDMVKSGLAELDIVPTDWGGSYEFVEISAKTGMGVEELLEIVLLQADLLELKANPKAKAKATIIESSLQKGRGPVATIIMQNGSLRVGDSIVAGSSYGRVRALNDDKGNTLKVITPGECGVIIGLSEVPTAGETLISVNNEKEAREYANKIYDYERQKELSKSTKVTIDELSTKLAEGELKSLPVIIKTDVIGSLEAIRTSLEKLNNEEVRVNIIHSGVGGITQNDIALASASENSVILGFNVRPTGEVKQVAKDNGVNIKTYNVIYNLIDDVKGLLSGLMSPIITEEEIGQAEVRQVINVPKVGQIAGCMVTDGSIQRGAKIRVIRDGVVIFKGNISSLKRFKDDAKEVAKGYECGVGIEGYNDMRVGDYIESFNELESKVEL